MKNYTIEEKIEILKALDHYIDALDRGRHRFADSGEFLPQIWKLRDIRAKLILDTTTNE